MSPTAQGLRYMLEATLLFSVMGVLVKIAGTTVPVAEIVLARCIVGLVACGVPLVRRRMSILGHQRGWLALRGCCGSGALFCFFYAVTELPLADATTIQFTNPMWVVIFAAPLLGERLRLTDGIAAISCLIGVALVLQPSLFFGAEARLPLYQGSIALLGALLTAIAYVSVRKLRKSDDELVIIIWLPLIAFLPALVWSIYEGYVPSLSELSVLLAIGIVTQLAQLRLTRGLKLCPAGLATAMTYVQVVLAFVWGLLMFDEQPNLLAVFGCVMIVGVTFSHARRRTGERSD